LLKKFFRIGVIAVILASLFSTFVASPALADGITWTSQTTPLVENDWRSVTYGAGLFVAVSIEGNVMTSSDGTTWDSQPAPADNDWQSVTYGAGLFVAVGSFGANRVMTSPDGITWTLQNAAQANSWYSVTYGTVGVAGLFVAVSYSSSTKQVMTSPNGITWTARDTPSPARDWHSIAYGNGTFVAVARSGTGNRVMTSSDGTNWINQTSAEDNAWYSVTFGNNLFVAVSIGGTNRVMTSPNGITWTARQVPIGTDSSWRSVTFGNNLFVAVSGDKLNNRVMTSSDGTNWTSRLSNRNNSWYSVAYGNGVFVATSDSGARNRVMRSVFPPAFTLSSSSESRTVDTAATGFTANSTGGPIASFAINATPPGMSFNTTTGALTGTPNTVASATNYTITATNASGNATQTFALTVTAAPVSVDNSAAQAAAQAEAARRAQEQKELAEILALIPKIGELTLSLGETTKSLYSTKCVKGKTTKNVKKGAKCPKGFIKKK